MWAGHTVYSQVLLVWWHPHCALEQGQGPSTLATKESTLESASFSRCFLHCPPINFLKHLSSLPSVWSPYYLEDGLLNFSLLVSSQSSGSHAHGSNTFTSCIPGFCVPCLVHTTSCSEELTLACVQLSSSAPLHFPVEFFL